MLEQSLPRWKIWLLAIRPPTLLAGIGPIVLGMSFGWQRLVEAGITAPMQPLLAGLAALLLVVLLQSAANLVNDAKDAEKGVDSGERLGPVRVVQKGLLTREAVKGGYKVLFLLAGLLVLGLTLRHGDWLILEVAALCSLAAYAYTAGPFPLAYYALGEIVALIFFGPVAVMGTSYLHTREIQLEAALWGCGSGFIAAAVMAINNFRDRSGDAFAGKTTLATLLGESRGRLLPLLLLSASCFWLIAFGWKHEKLVFGSLAALLAASYVLVLIRPLLFGPPAALNQALKRTALFNLLYALGFAVLVWV